MVWNCFSPHLCVGFLFLVLYPVRRLLLPSSLVPSRPSPIHCPQLFTHNLSSHNLLTQNFSTYKHTTCPHTTWHRRSLCPQLVIKQIAHTCHQTNCSHITCHHTTCSHTTCHHTTCSHTNCSHTTCSHRTPHTHTHTTCHHTTCSHTTSPHTHTCSEIAYRITDVECISRAKTLQLNLTGEIGRLNVRNSVKWAFYVLARRINLFWCSSFRLRKPCKMRKLKPGCFEAARWFLG